MEISTKTMINDDEGVWEDLPDRSPPLSSETCAIPAPKNAVIPLPNTNNRTNNRPTRTATSTSSTTNNVRPQTRRQSSFPLNQNTLLIKFALRFGICFIQDIWTVDVLMRLAGLSLIVGVLSRAFLWSFYCFLYPKQVLMVTTLIAGLVVPAIVYYAPKIKSVLERLEKCGDPMDVLIELLGSSLNARDLRMVFSAAFYVFPTLVGMRALQFLTDTVGTFYAASIAFLLIAAVYTNTKLKQTGKFILVANQCIKTCLYILYGCALFTVLVDSRHGTKHIPSLASQFFLATSVILYELSDYDLSLAVRSALRRTLRETFQEVGNTIQQDQLLQLTMLRWIADYWSSSDRASSSTSAGDSGSSAGAQPLRHRSTSRLRTKELEWSELWTMLQATTTQMSAEVRTLQCDDSVSGTLVDSTPPRASVGLGSAQEPMALLDGNDESPIVSSNPPSTQGSAYPSAHNKSGGQSHTPPSENENDLMHGLRQMLASMDIDDRAKPAVVAYKNLVETLPLSSRTAFVLGLSRRCPGCILLILYMLLALFRVYFASFMAMALLIPFAVFESGQVRLWLDTCRILSGDNRQEGSISTLDLRSFDSMTMILLNENVYATTQSSTLLAVWKNVRASVRALELSLTVARCGQTATDAVNFGANILSLVNFGLEVTEHGWFHGISVLARELLHLQSTGTDISALTHGVDSPEGATYTSAAVGAFRNSQRMGRNLSALSQEGTASEIVALLVGVLPLLVGQGWLWGQAVAPPPQPDTGITIEELDDEELADEALDGNDVKRIVAKDDQSPDVNKGSTQSELEACMDVPLTVNDVLLPVDPGTIKCTIDQSSSLDIKETATLSHAVHAARSQSLTGLDICYEPASMRFVNDTNDKITTAASAADAFAPTLGFNMIREFEEDDDGFEALENLVLDDSGMGALSVDDEKEIKERLSLPVSREEIDESKDTAVQSLTGEKMTRAENEDDGSIWLKVGIGGVAVLGAVAGIAAAARQGHDEEQKRRKREGNSS